MMAPELLAALDAADTIALAAVRELIGWNKQAQSYVIKAGLIRPVSGRGPHGGYRVTRSDALILLAAAALAPSAGVATVTMLRAIQDGDITAQALAAVLAGKEDPGPS